jgi:hypothetical protein
MIAHYEIEQGTEDWFKIRWGKIGGTGSQGLFVNSDTLLLQVLSQVTEEFNVEDGYSSREMERGTELEPFAREELSKYLDIEIFQCGWIQSLENELIGISPDGINRDETITFEIKCPGSKKHLKTLMDNDIPKDNIHQCIHYFTVNPKLKKHYFCSFRPESTIRKIFVKELTRDSLVDIGWTIKGKIKEDRGLGIKEYVSVLPDIRTIQEWVDYSTKSAEKLKLELTETLTKLNF